MTAWREEDRLPSPPATSSPSLLPPSLCGRKDDLAWLLGRQAGHQKTMTVKRKSLVLEGLFGRRREEGMPENWLRRPGLSLGSQ